MTDSLLISLQGQLVFVSISYFIYVLIYTLKYVLVYVLIHIPIYQTSSQSRYLFNLIHLPQR